MTVAAARIRDTPLEAAALEAAVLASTDGALVTFRGVIRDHDGGRGVTALEYSAHPDAAAFLAAACARAAIDGVTVAAEHRIGLLAVGDIALIAVAAAAHRAEAFAACGALVDDIKATVPIWKRQHHTDGTVAWQNL